MGWKKVDVALKSAPVDRGVYFVAMQAGGGKVRMLYVGSTSTQSNLRATFQKLFGGGGAIDPWDGNFRSFLKNASRSQLLVDWIVLRYPQDTVGDYVMENMLDVGIFPRFNPRSEMRWDKKDEPFMQY